MKLPSVVSAFAFMTIRLPTRLKGITTLAESLDTMGSPLKSKGSFSKLVSVKELERGGESCFTFISTFPFIYAEAMRILMHIIREMKNMAYNLFCKNKGYAQFEDFKAVKKTPVKKINIW
jgi:hypothetical protein